MNHGKDNKGKRYDPVLPIQLQTDYFIKLF